MTSDVPDKPVSGEKRLSSLDDAESRLIDFRDTCDKKQKVCSPNVAVVTGSTRRGPTTDVTGIVTSSSTADFPLVNGESAVSGDTEQSPTPSENSVKQISLTDIPPPLIPTSELKPENALSVTFLKILRELARNQLPSGPHNGNTKLLQSHSKHSPPSADNGSSHKPANQSGPSMPGSELTNGEHSISDETMSSDLQTRSVSPSNLSNSSNKLFEAVLIEQVLRRSLTMLVANWRNRKLYQKKLCNFSH